MEKLIPNNVRQRSPTHLGVVELDSVYHAHGNRFFYQEAAARLGLSATKIWLDETGHVRHDLEMQVLCCGAFESCCQGPKLRRPSPTVYVIRPSALGFVVLVTIAWRGDSRHRELHHEMAQRIAH